METLERARGMMVGIGVGNLLGIPWEGWTRTQIERRRSGGVREITARDGHPDDDDLAQATLLAEASIETGQLDVNDLARRFWAWGELNGAGMGGLTRRTLTHFGGASPRQGLRNFVRFGELPPVEPREPSGADANDAARLAWEESGRDSAGNGSVMRCGPVALRWLSDEEALARNSVISAIVTHWDHRCVWSTVLTDFAIAACLRAEPIEPDTLLARASDALERCSAHLAHYELPEEPPFDVRQAIEIALAVDVPMDNLRLDSGGIGYAPKTLGAVLWASRHPASIKEGLTAIVSAGGDTDSNAAPAGAALGARFGLSGFPSAWLERTAEIRCWRSPVEGWIERRPLEHYADELLAIAEA